MSVSFQFVDVKGGRIFSIKNAFFLHPIEVLLSDFIDRTLNISFDSGLRKVHLQERFRMATNFFPRFLYGIDIVGKGGHLFCVLFFWPNGPKCSDFYHNTPYIKRTRTTPSMARIFPRSSSLTGESTSIMVHAHSVRWRFKRLAILICSSASTAVICPIILGMFR